MPVPVTFGFPDTDGTAWGNYKAYVELFHPLISIRQVHPLCPFSKRERLVVWLCVQIKSSTRLQCARMRMF